MTTPIYCNGARVGYVEAGTFHKTIQGSRHMLRTPRAIAFDASTLRDAAHAGAHAVCVRDSESGIVYTTSLQRLHDHGAPFDRGFGKQWLMTIEHWSINGATPKIDQQAARESNQRAAVQPTLFQETAA